MRNAPLFVSIVITLVTCNLSPISGFSVLPQRKGETNAQRRPAMSFAPEEDRASTSRSQFLQGIFISTVSFLALPTQTCAKSYSSNAKNMDRLASGDSSGGSVYDNNPSTPSGRKRRAMTGCKVPSARQETGSLMKVASLSERECNLQVMEGDTEPMLQALQKLDCPTCPYGINPQR